MDTFFKNNNIDFIINSIIEFSFEFEYDELKKNMELQEIPDTELKKLTKEEINKSFNDNIFKIKLPDGKIIDAESIHKHSIENNIKEPVIFINPNFKYVRWIINKDFLNPQLKNKIRNLLKSNKNIDFKNLEDLILEDDIKEKETVGYINKLPIKTTEFISEGKFIIKSSCSRKYARKLIYDTIQELKIEKNIYVKRKMKKDKQYIIYYSIFIFFLTIIWFLSKQSEYFENWFLNILGLLLFIIPLVVMRLINHSIFDSIINKKKAEKNYESEYYNKLSMS